MADNQPEKPANEEKKGESSDSGAPIYRHAMPEKEGFTPVPEESNIEAITEHIEATIGPIHKVFHELISDHVHIDVHWVKPTKKRPCHVLITTGMSDRAMNTPAELDGFDHAELVLCLPPDWPMEEEQWKEDKNYWPVRWLKFLARFPHEFKTWLGWGHTIPNGDPAKPFSSDTDLTTWLLLPSALLPEDFHELELENGTIIRFFSLYAIHTEEAQLKLSQGAEVLLDKFGSAQVTDLLHLERINLVTGPKKKGNGGLFGWLKKK